MMKLNNYLILAFILLTLFSCRDKSCDGVYCLNNGICVEGVCECELGTGGTNCELDEPCELLNCENGGICIDGTCDCPDGYFGINCELFDNCTVIVCENNGNCVNGACLCIDGFLGEFCEIAVSSSFLGQYMVTDACQNSPLTSYTIEILPGSSPLDLEIVNLRNEGSTVFTSYSSNEIFVFNSQSLPSTLLITGSITKSVQILTIQYNYSFMGSGESCTITSF